MMRKHKVLLGVIVIILILAAVAFFFVKKYQIAAGTGNVSETCQSSDIEAVASGENVPEKKLPERATSSKTDETAEKTEPEQIGEPVPEQVEEPASQKDNGYYGALRVDGAHLTDAEGNPVQLRGVSTHGLAWFPEYVNEEAIAFMQKDWGINVIRLALYPAGYGGYCVSGEEQQKKMEELIDTGVRATTENNMYVIIDWHVLEEGNPNTYLEQAKEFFEKISDKYRDYENVLYEICNEPNGGTSWSDIKTYAENVIPVIRENDEDAIIIVGTPEWSQRVDAAAEDPITGWENVMYGLHFYAGTHKEWLRDRADQALTAGLPIFVSEFGLCDASGNGSNDIEQANLWMEWMNENFVSCIQWNLSNKNETCALINSSCTKTTDWEENELTESGIWMLNHIADNFGRQHDTEERSASKPTPESKPIPDIAESKSNGFQDGDAEITPVSNWENGDSVCTQYAVKITNSSGQTEGSWTLTISFNREISLQNGWCGKYSFSGCTLTITPEDYNSELEAGKSIMDIGFIVESASELSVEDIALTWK